MSRAKLRAAVDRGAAGGTLCSPGSAWHPHFPRGDHDASVALPDPPLVPLQLLVRGAC